MTIRQLAEAREVVGYWQMGAGDLTTATTLDGHGSVVMIQAEGQNVRYRTDGVNPTAAVGMLLEVGAIHVINMPDGSQNDIKVIEAAVGGILNITWFR
jgi:hypothetical protein